MVIGDFKADTKPNVRITASIDFNDRFSCLSCDSLINTPTRKTISAATCIDHIHVKSTTSNNSGVSGMNVSDHDAKLCSSLIKIIEKSYDMHC